MLVSWDAVLSVLWSLHSCVKILSCEKPAFLFSFLGFSPRSHFKPNKHIWIVNYSKYCFMQHSSLDAVMHMQTDQIVMKGGEESKKGKVGKPDLPRPLLCKSRMIEKAFWSRYWCCFLVFFSLFLVNPTRGRQLFTPERTTGEEGRCANPEKLTRKTTKHAWRASHFLHRQSDLYPLLHRNIPLFSCHSSSRELRDAFLQTSPCIPILAWKGVRGGKLNDSPTWTREWLPVSDVD